MVIFLIILIISGCLSDGGTPTTTRATTTTTTTLTTTTSMSTSTTASTTTSTSTTTPTTTTTSTTTTTLSSPSSILESLREKISNNTIKFSLFSRSQQDFLLNMTWVQDGLESSEFEYIETLPTDFNPRNNTFDRDKGGWPDIYEIGVMGDVLKQSDDNELEIFESEHALVVYHKNVELRNVQITILAVEEAASRNLRVLGEAPKIDVFIYSDRAEFKDVYGDGSDNLIGFANSDGLHVLSPLNIVYNTHDAFSRLVIHEYSHLATPRIMYAWFAEGYAQYIEDSPYFRNLAVCKNYDFPLTFEYGETDYEKYRTYDCGHHAVEYIVETYGENVLGEIAKSGFEKAIGLNESEFISQYKTNLRI
jgi:hypothetical protein